MKSKKLKQMNVENKQERRKLNRQRMKSKSKKKE